MRKAGFALLFLLAATLISVLPARAEDGDKKFDVTGEVRTRWDYSENTSDFTDNADDTAEFFPYRVGLGVHGSFSDNVSAKIQVQNFGFFGNDPTAKSGGTPLNQVTSTSSSSGTDLYEGFLQVDELWGSGLGLRAGRAEHTLGSELHMGDSDFYNGQSFDGLRFMWKNDTLDMNFFYYLVSEQLNFEDQRELWGATAAFSLGGGNHHIEPYLLGTRNTANGTGRENTWTLGALYNHPWAEGSAFDWSAEFALQSGTLGTDTTPAPVTPTCLNSECDVSAWILEGTFGWTLADKHRFHIGLLHASGDDDSADLDVEGFQPLFPDLHANNRLGDLDVDSLSNITDINVGYGWMGEKNKLRASIHNLTLAEEQSFVGPPAHQEDDLGNELDLSWDHAYSESLAFQVGLANRFAGDVQDSQLAPNSADDALRAWWQLHLKWN